MSCPICERRKAVRFCPAKGEKICAVCCGTEREVSIDCPSDCSYLIAAHRYEDGHQRALPPDTPLLDETISQDIVYTHQQLMAALAFSIAKFCAVHPDAVDTDVLAAIQSLAQTYKTLTSGIIYEKPPDAPLPRELYAALMAFLSEVTPFHRVSSRPVPAIPGTSARRIPYYRPLAGHLWHYPAAHACARSIVCVAASQPKDNCEQVAGRLFSTHGRDAKPNFSRIRATR